LPYKIGVHIVVFAPFSKTIERALSLDAKSIANTWLEIRHYNTMLDGTAHELQSPSGSKSKIRNKKSKLSDIWFTNQEISELKRGQDT